MPNEIKNALKALTSHVTANHTMSRQLPVAGSSTVSVMVWTISGIVLASCGGGGGGGAGGSGLSVSGGGSNGDGGGGGSNASGPSGKIARVVDGPVKDAAVYFDIDGDGEVSDSEREAQKQNGDPMYITDANGYVNAPIEYEGHFFIANVDNATDTATGDTLSGEYQSLSTGGIATPITDLITDQIGASGSDADAQGVLDDIFGTDGLVTVADIRDAEKYKIQEYDVPKPTLPSDPTNAEEQAQYDRDITKYKTSVIMKSSLALSEIDKDEAFTNLESSIARVDALKQIFDDDPNNGDSALMARIDARVDAGREILGISKPLAQPDSSISPINEDSVFRFPQNSEAIFGFDDPNGNSDDAAASRFTGIYVKSSVDFSQADDDAHTVNLLYDGSALSGHEVARGDSLPDNLPPEAGFYYVSYENLSLLSTRPSPDDSGMLEFEYYVFDGEQWSDKAILEITVSTVNDPPTAIAVGTQSLTAIDENTVTTGMKVADLTVDDADGPPHRLEVRGDNTGFFEIRNEDELWLVVDTGEILDYETTPTLTVQVGVSGDSIITPVNITVAVNNVNDNAPVISREGGQNQVQNPLDEGLYSIDTDTGYSYTASDADGGTSTLRVSGDVQDRFAIDASGNLQIKAGAEFDYKTPADRAITLTITATDSGVGSGNPPVAATQEVIITFGDANDAPTATPRAGISTNDNAPYTFSAVDFGFRDEDVGDFDNQFDSVIITSLPAQGQGTLELNGNQVIVNTPIIFTDITNGLLVYTPTEVSQGQPYNAQIGYRVLDDGDGNGAHKLSSATATLVIAVEQNQSATGVAVGTRFLTAIDENTVTTGMKVADLRVDDADGPPHRLEVRGDNTGFFEIRNEDELWLVVDTGEILDYETTPTLTVQVGVSGVPDITPVNISVAVNNVNDNAPEISLEGGQNQVQNPLDEGIFPNTPTDTGYSYTANDADGGTSTLSLSGDPQNRFAIDASGKLQIKAGAEFDYETPADRAITLTITATDSGVGSGISPAAATQEVIITFGDANDAPTATPKLGISTTDDTAYALEAADFGFSDVDAGDNEFDSVIITSLPGAGQGTLALSGASVRVGDAITFAQIDAGEFIYTPNEVQPGQTYNVQIGYRVQDDGDGSGGNGLSSDVATLAIRVGPNQSATGVALERQHLNAIDENTDLTAGMKVADLTVDDTDGPPHRLEVRGDNTGFFVIRNEDELWLVLQEGQTLDYESTPALTAQVGVSGDLDTNTNPITVAVNNINDNTPEIERTGTQNKLHEGTFTSNRGRFDTGYSYTASDADGGTSTLRVSGDPQDRFEIDADGNLRIKVDSTFDYEIPADRSITLTITATDSGVGSGNQPINATDIVTITFTNLYDEPVVITPSGAPVPLDEGLYSIDTDTGYRYVASDADDPDQTISLTVTGDPLNRFQLDRDGNLQIKAGSSFDYETPEGRAINLGITYFQSISTNITEPVTITFRDVSTEINIDSGDAYFSIAIDGNLVTGAVLTATEITPDPDIDDAVYSYQWYHIGAGTSGTDVDISGATSKSYTIADTDEGKRIGVRVSYEEDSFQSDGTTHTGTETVTAELPIVDFTEIRDISSEIVYSSESITRLLLAGISTEETGDRLILREFGGNFRSVFDITNPHRATESSAESSYVYGISGVDKDHFMFVQNGSRISIVSKTGFNYENPTDSDQDNNYEFTLASSSILGVGPISYTLTIVDDISEARVKTATASIIETSSSIKFTSLEDAVRAYSGIDDALLRHSATFGGAVVDGANPHRATVTFEVAGQADIVFTYELSGDDVNDVLLVQDGNDVSLITVAGLDYEHPADEDEMSTYSVVETITTTSPNLPSAHRAVSTTYTLSVTDKPSEVSIEVYENHPLYKPLEIDSVDLQGYQLTQGYVDNALFTIDNSGQVRWKAIPDHEAPHDSDGDNLYKIELSRTNSIGQMDHVQVDIMVKDIGINSPPEEDYSPILLLHPEDVADEHLPSDFVQHLILGYNTWRVPATGPVIIQYSVDMDNIASFYNNNQIDISQFYSILDAALLSFEQAANLKFIEVAHGERDDNVPYIYVELDPNTFGSGANRFIDEAKVLILGGSVHFTSNKLYVASNTGSVQRTITHELGHALGLAHPFDESLGWPGDRDYFDSPLSIISYNGGLRTLQPADIEALQFLYGAPGTDFMGVESIMEESRFASRLAVGAQTVTSIDENTDLIAGIKVTNIFVTDRDRGAFGTLEIVGDHAEFFEIRSSDPNDDISSFHHGELWLALKEGESLENIDTLEVHVRLVEKNSTRTEDITITVNNVGSSGATGSSDRTSGVVGDADQIKINETVDEGQSVIANLVDLDLGEIDLTEITIGGDDKDEVQIRQTQNGGVLEFVSAPDFEAPEDDDEDNVYEITLYDDLTSIEVDITVIDIPEI